MSQCLFCEYFIICVYFFFIGIFEWIKAYEFFVTRVNFESELQLMSQISDPNIIDLVGVCIKDKPHCMIFEYLQFGDLKRFLLQQHDSQDAAEKSVCQDNSDILRWRNTSEYVVGPTCLNLVTGILEKDECAEEFGVK